MSSDRDEQMREAAREVLRELMPGMLSEALAGAAPNGHANGAGHAPNGQANGGGHEANGNAHSAPRAVPDGATPAVVPTIPAPPVAAVLRPSTWSGPAVPGEIIGDGAPTPETRAPASGDGVVPSAAAGSAAGSAGSGQPALGREARPGVRLEAVTIDSDADLDAFARALAARMENPRDRRSIRTGALRFTLRRTSSASPGHQGGQGTASPSAIHVAKGAVTERTVRDAAQRGARLVLARGAVLTPLARDQARALRVEIEREGKC